MTNTVRRFNELGRETFARAIATYREDTASPTPSSLVEVDELCEDVEGAPQIEVRHFENRFDFACYLNGQLAGAWRHGLDLDRGVVDWIAALYFDALTRDGEKLKIGEDARYSASKAFNRAYRHLVAGPLWSYELHADNARALLSTGLATGGDYFEQLASRQQFHTNPTIVATAQRLYFEPSSAKLKRGALAIGRPGELRRYVTLVRQLDLNFDLYAMSVERLLELLPDEFAPWREAG